MFGVEVYGSVGTVSGRPRYGRLVAFQACGLFLPVVPSTKRPPRQYHDTPLQSQLHAMPASVMMPRPTSRDRPSTRGILRLIAMGELAIWICSSRFTARHLTLPALLWLRIRSRRSRLSQASTSTALTIDEPPFVSPVGTSRIVSLPIKAFASSHTNTDHLPL